MLPLQNPQVWFGLGSFILKCRKYKEGSFSFFYNFIFLLEADLIFSSSSGKGEDGNKKCFKKIV